MQEKELYIPIQRWLKRQGYIVKSDWINKGAAKYRVDVIGVKNSGSAYRDDIEIVAVEAKIWGDVKALGQTANYRDFTHKVYFATSCPETAEYLRDDCSQKNLGLLLVDVKSGVVKELIAAPFEKPRNESKTAELLGNLKIVNCTICRSYFDVIEEWDDSLWFVRKTKFQGKKSNINCYICGECNLKIFKMRSKEE